VLKNHIHFEVPSKHVDFLSLSSMRDGYCIDIMIPNMRKRGKKRITPLIRQFPRSTQYGATDLPVCDARYIRPGGKQKNGWRDKRTHSFATGPVIAEPFISPLGLTITPALSYRYKVNFSRYGDYRQEGTDLKVEEDTISPAPCFSLTNNNSRHSCENKKGQR
jgi:hypothetical protein